MTEKDKQPKLKRRWLRFSLRTFLIALTIFCVWFGWYLYRVEQQREAVKWVRANGGTVHYDDELDLKRGRLGKGQPSTPNWLLEMLGVDYFSTVEQVEGVFTERGDLTPLVALTELGYLTLNHMPVSDLTPLEGLTNLKVLLLEDTLVSDISPLTGLMNLERLRLSSTQVSDLAPLEAMTNLETLELNNTPVSDLTLLATLENLSILNLTDTPVSDATPLAGLTKLRVLWLDNTQVSDVTAFTGLANLEFLDLRNTKVSDEDTEKLKQVLPNCTIVH